MPRRASVGGPVANKVTAAITDQLPFDPISTADALNTPIHTLGILNLGKLITLKEEDALDPTARAPHACREPVEGHVAACPP
jgi:hypothetical protein